MMLFRSVALLVILTTRFEDLRARSDQCQVVSIDTEELKGQCCVYYKNNIQNQGPINTFRHDGRPAVEDDRRPFSVPNSGSDVAFDDPARLDEGNRRHTLPEIIGPEVYHADKTDNDPPVVDKVNRNYHNRTNVQKVNNATIIVGTTSSAEPGNITIPDIGNRNNVNVPETCTRGYAKDSNGNCVEIFDD